MSLHDKLTQICSVTPETFTAFRDRLSPEWIEQALTATGTATLRRRRLPAEQSSGWSSAWRCCATVASRRS